MSDPTESPKVSTRRRWPWLVGAMFAAGAAILGPRPDLEFAPRPADLPESLTDLDAHLAEREARHSDVTPGAEAGVVWADPKKPTRTPLALVYLHGFSATRRETAPLCDQVARELGANLYYPRLRGHGRAGDAMAEPGTDDWLQDGYEAVEVGRRLGERVVLVGTSTGATIALWHAAAGTLQDVAALVCIAPNFHPRKPGSSLLGWPWGRALARIAMGPTYRFTPMNAEQERYWTTAYPSGAIVEMMGLIRMLAAADLGRITAPTLVVYHPDDQVIDPRLVEQRFPEIGAATKELVAFDDSDSPAKHVIAGAITSPRSTDAVAAILLRFLRGALSPAR